jgi:YggT family protein
VELIILIGWIFNLIYIAILGRIILSFVIPMLGASPNPILVQIYQGLGQITEPILGPIRVLLNRTLLRVVPALSMFDFSPIVAIILLQIIQAYLVRALV